MLRATKFWMRVRVQSQKYSRLVELGFSSGTFTIPAEQFLHLLDTGAIEVDFKIEDEFRKGES